MPIDGKLAKYFHYQMKPNYHRSKSFRQSLISVKFLLVFQMAVGKMGGRFYQVKGRHIFYAIRQILTLIENRWWAMAFPQRS